jgi:hypothetical protein
LGQLLRLGYHFEILISLLQQFGQGTRRQDDSRPSGKDTDVLKDTADLCHDIQKVTLPAVSFVKPGDCVDEHPASSKLNLFEGFIIR